MEIKITRTQNPQELTEEAKLGFGKHFTDHMFIMDYEMGKGWHNARIVPFGYISIHPASTVLHYGSGRPLPGSSGGYGKYQKNERLC